jgi:tetratricopeptide (TPR) repeat protein
MKKRTPGVQKHREGELAMNHPSVWADLVGTWALGLVRSLALAVLLLALPAPALASDESELAFHRGVAAFGEGDQERAQQRFEEVLREEPENASALHYLGLIAIQNGDIPTAIDTLQQVVALDPDDSAARIDLGAQLLKLQRNDEALAQFDAVLERNPDHAMALLYQGIALYRIGAYEDALVSLGRALEMDKERSAEGNYYIGLSEAHLGNASAAAAAFSTSASAAPQHPLGRSASTLSRQAVRADRRWSVATTLGFEYDDNVRLSPNDTNSGPQPGSSDSGAAVVRLQGQFEAYGDEQFSWRVGYDGYLQVYTNTTDDDFGTVQASPNDLSQQTHVGWTNMTYDFESVSLGLRYDFSYTAIDLTDDFRNIHRLAPTVYVPVSDWGLFLAYYQFLYYDYDVDSGNSEAFDRSGPQNSIGAQQFVFLPAPFRYTVIGVLLTNFDSDGTEFRHNGVEVSAGVEMDLPWGISAAALYRYAHRNYTKVSAVPPSLVEPQKREDDEHEISFNLDRTFARRFNVSLAGSYATNDSNIENFDIDRFRIGTYFRYAF